VQALNSDAIPAFGSVVSARTVVPCNHVVIEQLAPEISRRLSAWGEAAFGSSARCQAATKS
jgi:hypothetical protein